MDASLYLRRAGITRLKADATLAGWVGDRVYPPQRPAGPTWPFIGWGVPIVGPFVASCLDGNEIDFVVHVYADTTGTGGSTVAGEERASEIAARVVTVLSEAGEVDLAEHGCPVPATAHFTWLQTQVIQDSAEADAFHAIASFRATISA